MGPNSLMVVYVDPLGKTSTSTGSSILLESYKAICLMGVVALGAAFHYGLPSGFKY